MNLVDKFVFRALKIGASGCFIGMMVVVVLRIADRFVAGVGGAWTDEIIELLFGWMVFLGAAALWRDRDHFKIYWLETKLSAARALVLRTSIDLIVLAFLFFMTWKGFELTTRVPSTSSILQLPRSLWLSAIPVSGVIMLAYTFFGIIGRFKAKTKGVV